MSNCTQLATAARSDTRSVTIEAPPREVFEFVADPRNLPYWAVGFCRSIRHDTQDRWLVTTAAGEIAMRYETNEAARTIDFRFAPADGIEAAAFSRAYRMATARCTSSRSFSSMTCLTKRSRPRSGLWSES